MDPGLFRSFATALFKMSTVKLQDADIRELVADREGREKYLPGGQLPTNSLGDQGVGYAMKLAFKDHMGLAAGNYDLKANKKRKGVYQDVRDYAVTGMKGGLTGLGLLSAGKTLMGDIRSAADIGSAATKRQARRFAGAGALIAVADKAYRHHDAKPEDKTGLKPLKKTAGVTPDPGRTFSSPSLSFDAARRTGGFKSEVVRSLNKPPKVVQLGRKFVR